MDNFRDIEMIEKYLSKVLDGPTTAAFEKAMQEDAVLKQSVLVHQDILKGIDIVLDKDIVDSINSAAARFKKRGGLAQKKLDAATLRDDSLSAEKPSVKNQIAKQGGLLKVDKKQKKPAKIKSIINRKLLSIAASLLLLLTAGYYLMKPTTYNQIHATYAAINKQELGDRLYEGLDLNSSGLIPAEKDTFLKAALEKYRVCSDIPCEYNNLATVFKQLPDTAPIEIRQAILWNLGLSAYLKQENNSVEAISFFEKIIALEDTKSPYFSKSQKLLKELSTK